MIIIANKMNQNQIIKRTKFEHVFFISLSAMEAAKQLEQITANTITILHNHKKDFNMLVRTVSVSKKLELAIPKSFGGVLFNASADETNSSIEKYEPLLKFIRSSARMEFLWQICKNQTNIFQ